MGKTKIKTMDPLVEKLKEELGIKEEVPQEEKLPQVSKAKKPGKTKPRSKKYQEKVADLNRSKTYPIAEAVEMVKKLSYSKFPGTLEAHVNTIESKAPDIHRGLGKLNQPSEELVANVKTLLQTVGKTKIRKVSLSPTMGPSVKLDLASIF